ncbi:MAG: hypothetical protein PHY34_05985 [Patescibacteria group bacterium]|nr:hypothetical protein [Patescibacteria group bacterium]MDD5716054.1 hypothetical protein [Patescibacteria group bacterium]
MEDTKKYINTVIFILCSIVVLCPLFVGLQVKSLPPHPGGLLILLFGGVLHTIGLRVSIRKGDTPAACIIGLFCLFWWYIGTMLALIALGIATKEQYVVGLKWLEPPIALLIYILSYQYSAKKHLFRVLVGLGTTVVYLWLAKALIPALEAGVPFVVGALGVGSVWALAIQLNLHKKAAEKEAAEKA